MAEPTVLLVASFDTALHAHAAHRQRALTRLGCRVVPFDLSERPGLLGRLTGGDLESRFKKAVVAEHPDVVLMIGGEGLSPEAISRAKADGLGIWVNWMPNHLEGLDTVVARAAACDHVFGIGTDVAARAEQVLGRPVGVLPLAADPSVYRPHRSRDQYRANVVFAGRATPRREALLSEVLEFGLAVWGPGWRQTSLRDYCRGELLDQEEFVRAYGGASVAVNIHHQANGVTPDASCNQRLFEVAAIGIPQVVDNRGDLSSYFTPGSDCLVYETVDDLRSCVEGALMDLPAAEEMASEARNVTLTRHTYMHRMQELLAHVGIQPLAVTRD